MKPDQYYPEFLRFVFMHSPKTKIRNMRPGGGPSWFYCAVGNFIRKNELTNKDNHFWGYYHDVCDTASNIVEKFPPQLTSRLESVSGFKSYGSLQKYLWENHNEDVVYYVPIKKIVDVNLV